MIKDQLDKDLKQALLSGDSGRATVLRGLKSAILYAELATSKRSEGLDDESVIALLQKEAKKRQESADLYTQGGDETRAATELAEKKLIETYLPAQLSEAEVTDLVKSAIAETGAQDVKQLGQVIALVKTKAKGAADGALIARIAKNNLEK
jgi:uncharacterized protein YqeY